jgi:hypothetical protein
MLQDFLREIDLERLMREAVAESVLSAKQLW